MRMVASAIFYLVLLSSFATTLAAQENDLAKSSVRINEVAAKGTSGVCSGDDWIELFNSGEHPVDLERFGLHDDKGFSHEESFSFPPGTVIQPMSYMLLCNKQKDDPLSPKFGIKGDDTISLTRSPTTDPNNNSVTVGVSRQGEDFFDIVSRVSIPGTQHAFDITYAFDPETRQWDYTFSPTPGTENVMTQVPSLEERNAQLKLALAAQNRVGTAFFNMDNLGLPVEDGFDTVLYLSLEMAADDYNYMIENTYFEMYRPIQVLKLTTTDGTEIVSIDAPGRIRPKGQSSLFLSICVGTVAFPFQVELADDKTFFGMERFYLRNHVGDFSYMRDYAYNRMLARFGLPYLRSRNVRVKINNQLHGYYTLLEAPDQDYVFHRSFPDFDPQRYALYKVKSMAIDCGSFTPEEIAGAEARLDETSTPPYQFERGEHKPSVPRLTMFDIGECLEAFDHYLYKTGFQDTVLAWLRNGRSCAEMLLDTGLIDRDLGNDKFDKEIRTFISQDFSEEQRCDVGCQNTDLADRVDQVNWLKTFAFYAVTMNSDSPLVNGNNYLLAQSGEEENGGVGGWKIVAYDFNVAKVTNCHGAICDTRFVHWSLARPTCTSLEANSIAGPLLLNKTLHTQYLEYVHEFVETIYGNRTFIEELEQHAVEQEAFVLADDWSLMGGLCFFELSPDACEWNNDIRGLPILQYPLLPTMKARTEDVRRQLAAIRDGTIPRGPFVGIDGENHPWEPCADWRFQEPDSTACPHGCKYEGCHIPGWTVESYCDEETGKCLHGSYHEKCRGVHDGFRYEGMKDTPDGRKTFCRFTKGIPVKAIECPTGGAPIEEAPIIRGHNHVDHASRGPRTAGMTTSSLSALPLLLFVLCVCVE